MKMKMAASLYVTLIVVCMFFNHVQVESLSLRWRGIARRSVQSVQEEQRLRAALQNRNVTTFELKQNIVLTSNLPFRGDSFTVKGGVCTGGGRCIINGAKKYSCFRGTGSWEFINVIIEDCRLTNRSLTDAGGAAISIGNGIAGGNLRVADSIIRYNAANLRGGGVGVWSGRLNVEKSLFLDNAAQFGGAIHLNTFARGWFTSSNFTGNKAGNAGGAVFSHEGAVLDTTNCRFENNQAGRTGGAIELQNSYTYTAMLAKCSFIGNSARLAGGAVNVADFHIEKRFCSVNWVNNTVGTAVNHVSVGPSDLSIETGVYFCPTLPQGITIMEAKYRPYIKTLCTGCPA